MADGRADRLFQGSLRVLEAGDGLTRTETDNLGSLEIPAEAYWGINVARALENFQISGRPISIYTDLIFGYACVKQAAARANAELGVLPKDKAELIDRACEEIMDGRLLDQFVIDIMQGGAGTSTNMNINEVIANRGLELAGHEKGDYDHLDPNDDVNKSQSTNDSYPTAFKIGLAYSIERLLTELDRLENAFDRKAVEFSHVLKVGRTQLMDAVPMTLGQEFGGFAETLRDDHDNFERLIDALAEINLGGTAIGTGIAADRRFPSVVRRHLEEITGLDVRTSTNLVKATTDVGVFLDVSGALNRTAAKLSKICNDLRLLGSGPQAGLSEIFLPAKQAGSSIMPGKVNPVIPEVVNQVAFVIAGGHTTLFLAAEGGQLQLNAFEPVMAHVLFENLKWLTAAITTLRVNCIEGITANEEKLRGQVATFVGVITALIPEIGYNKASKLAQEALKNGGDIAELIAEQGLMTKEAVVAALSPERLANL